VILKICNIHGPLSETDCYIHTHKARSTGAKARVDMECAICVKMRIKSNLKWKQNNRVRKKKKYETNEDYKKQYLEKEKERYEQNGEAIRLRVRMWRWNLKLEAIIRYSNGNSACAICGEKDPRFLAMDHINNDGATHRKSMGPNGNTPLWAKRNDWPPIFQVLCHNCNYIKSISSKQIGRSKDAEYLRKLREEVLLHYSNPPKCVECEVCDPRLLTIDHINNEGNIHRKELGGKGSSRLCRWLKKNNYPPGFQILCFNHNMGKNIFSPSVLDNS
jgi:hypothetical protein